MNSSATSSKSELTYEMALKGQLPSSPKSGSSGIDDADCNLGCGENSTGKQPENNIQLEVNQ